MEEVDSRFLHLLQPIRDLTKNWEVDVAAQLGEYLEELDQICISFDNGKTTMNFMEAALLIQGSACIYSKKVEHLYMLVCQTLDCISNKKRAKLPTSLEPDGQDADATFTDKEEEYLSLNDIQDTSQANVDMRRHNQPGAVSIVLLTPMPLITPEEVEKKENPLLSRKGEVLASQKDFRMNICTPCSMGTFLLELAGLTPTLREEQHLGSPRTATGSWGATHLSLPAVTATCHLSLSPVRSSRIQPRGGASECQHGSNAAGPEDDDIPGAPGDDVEMTPASNEHVEAQRSMPQTRGYILQERPPSQDPTSHKKEVLDPWQSLDPFGDSEEKPFRKGRSFLVPHGLDDMVGGKRKRKGLRKLQDFMRWFSATYNNVMDGQKSRRKGPTFADLEALYWQQLKERLAAQRKLQTRGVSDGGVKLGGSGSFQRGLKAVPPSPPGAAVGARAGAWRCHCRDGGQVGVPPKGWGVPGGSGCPHLPSLSPQEMFMASSQKFAQETELSQHIRRWEERIEPLLQEQAQTPGEGRDPQGWGRDHRAPFDMREYGLALVGGCGGLGQWHSLASLVAGQPPFEVCRYLLASLQLANDAVVELEQDAGLEAALDTARLRLLTLRPAHERFQGYQPPSLRD
ncbi:CNDH2 protein, partial [Sapayoa aenigma]|nr:CNDH2 protein [Sapayoa aenigma]